MSSYGLHRRVGYRSQGWTVYEDFRCWCERRHFAMGRSKSYLGWRLRILGFILVRMVAVCFWRSSELIASNGSLSHLPFGQSWRSDAMGLGSVETVRGYTPKRRLCRALPCRSRTQEAAQTFLRLIDNPIRNVESVLRLLGSSARLDRSVLSRPPSSKSF